MRACAVFIVFLCFVVAPAPAHHAAVKHCVHHTVGTCKINSKHPKGTTARCKDGTYSRSHKSSGTCAGHKGVKYWYR